MKGQSEADNWRTIDRTMAKRKGNQKPTIEERLTVQWPKERAIRSRQLKNDWPYNGQKKGQSEADNWRTTDRTMAKGKGNQKPTIEERLTVQWPKERAIRSRQLKNDWPYNGQKKGDKGASNDLQSTFLLIKLMATRTLQKTAD